MSSATVILSAFHEASGQFVPASELQRRLATTSGGVAEKIAELQRLGYRIESHPHLGYRLVSAPDRLLGEDLRARIHTRLIGSEILVFEETASTNDVIEQLAHAGGHEGLVVFAESQTRGRGRHGRPWVSPRGKGLWFSVLLRPPIPPAAVARLTVAASVAVASAVRALAGLDTRIKWPNDVTVGGRKLAGILTEMRGEADEVTLAILGIGINVNCTPEDFPPTLLATATSARIETGRSQDRLALAAAVLEALDGTYRLALENFEAVSDEWARLSTTLGKHIVVALGPRRIEGYAQALNGDGALLVRKDNGQIEQIVGGDLVKEQP